MKKNNGVAKALVMFLQVTITMLSPMLICGFFGWWLDNKLDSTLPFLGMMLLGMLAAFRNFYHLVRGFYEKDLKEENAKQEYFDSMKREREGRQEQDRS